MFVRIVSQVVAVDAAVSEIIRISTWILLIRNGAAYSADEYSSVVVVERRTTTLTSKNGLI